MTEQVENLILEHLKAIKGDASILKQDMRDVKFRVGSVETYIASVLGDVVHHSSRFDDLDARVNRIEQRHELQP